jgi:competence protein ComEC
MNEPGTQPLLPAKHPVTWSDNVWRAPLLPVALAVTAGIVVDRYLVVPLLLSLVVVILGLIGWLVTRNRSPGVPLLLLGLGIAALGAAYHHLYRNVYSEDDIGNFASLEPRPVHLRGIVEEEPMIVRQANDEALQSIVHGDSSTMVLRATQLLQGDGWRTVSGRARLLVPGDFADVHVGDELDVMGHVVAPHGPANPGEFDLAAHDRDRRIGAEVVVAKTTDAAVKLAQGWPWSPRGWLAVLHGWGQRALLRSLPPDQSDLAMALLLGKGSPLPPAEWEKYLRTNVVHVVVVSGLHLAILGWFLWRALGVLQVPRRYGAALVALLLVGYALLTGAGMPVIRGAVTVCALSGGIVLRRPTLPINTLALAWLTIVFLNPTDLFGLGCQLTFLTVAVLWWTRSRWLQREDDPLQRLEEESRPAWHRGLRWLGGGVARWYALAVIVWLVEAPLLARHNHLISPIGVLLGPPLMVLAAIALVSGFLLLLADAVFWPLVPLFAAPTRWSLAGCQWLVTQGERLPGSYWYMSDVPLWWLWVFYGGLLAVLLLKPLQRRWRWCLLAALGWLCVGLLATTVRLPSEELRCTFLAVGHGGCTVIEAPDGRTLLYDTGALSGPDVSRRQIAPFLWQRGIRRVDEVLLSHADLDHFNGLPALAERFAIGQVTCTPTFDRKHTPGVPRTLAALEEHGIPRRIVRAGDLLAAGAVQIDVLHPPAEGPEGNENARSLVLRVRHDGHTLLLTGDIEGPGLERVLGLSPEHVDILQAPHHGSKAANTPALAAWAQPRIVISCQGPPRGPSHAPDPYKDIGARFLGTWPHGAITIRSHRTGLVVETFLTGERFAVRTDLR